MNKDGGAAFPFVIEDANNAKWKCGMTMRQWYKGMALCGFNSNPDFTNVLSDKLTKLSSDQADMMLAEDEAHEKEEQ